MTDETRRQKRRRKIAQKPKNIRFADLQRLLEDYVKKVLKILDEIEPLDENDDSDEGETEEDE